MFYLFFQVSRQRSRVASRSHGQDERAAGVLQRAPGGHQRGPAEAGGGRGQVQGDARVSRAREKNSIGFWVPVKCIQIRYIITTFITLTYCIQAASDTSQKTFNKCLLDAMYTRSLKKWIV